MADLAQYGTVTKAPPDMSAYGTVSHSPASSETPSLSLNGVGIAAVPPPTGVADRFARWTQNVMDDIRHGTDLTGVGAVLKGLGAHGLDYGQPEKVGEFMGSIPLGVLRTSKGAAEVSQGKFTEGGKDVLGGVSQALTMPSMVAAPEGVGAGAAAIDRIIPNADRASEAFKGVMTAAHDLPINITKPGDTALEIQRLSESGSSRPKVIGDFLKRVTDPDKGPLTYKEARDFYSNATRLSADEFNRLTPNMRRNVGQFTSDLNSALEEAADNVGKLDAYQSAMGEYHRAMQMRAAGKTLKDLVTNKVAQGAAAAGAGAAGYYGVKELLK